MISMEHITRLHEYFTERHVLGDEDVSTGAYAAVAETRKGYARKVTMRDWSYNDFLDYCLDHPDNPCLPEIHRVHNACDGDGRIVIMEHLEHVPVCYECEDIAADFYMDLRLEREGLCEYCLETLEEVVSFPGFHETALELYNVDGVCWDLHLWNVMLRADGTPVITDPWC